MSPGAGSGAPGGRGAAVLFEVDQLDSVMGRCEADVAHARRGSGQLTRNLEVCALQLFGAQADVSGECFCFCLAGGLLCGCAGGAGIGDL